MFCNLHCHSLFSKDGLDSVSDLVKTAAELGQPAIAITDHGNVAAWPELQRQAHKYGIKPIYGCEAYIKVQLEDKKAHHITLLVATKEGYNSMCKLSRLAAQQFKMTPIITLAQLLEHRRGLIVLSGCISSIAASLEEHELVEHYRLLDGAFGERFFVEVQPHAHPLQKAYDARARKVADKLRLPLVLTQDTHYITQAQGHVYRTRKAWGNNDDAELWDMSFGQGDGSPEARRTVEIADMCEFDLEKRQAHYIRIPGWEKAIDLAQQRVSRFPATYKARLSRELETIQAFDIVPYFALLCKVLKLGRQHGIKFGPGRGSAAGSLFSYLLGITAIDPVKHNLLFERFINPQRKGLPDIDIDVDASRRGQLLYLIQQEFGKTSVAQVCNYNRLQAAAALKEAGRCLGIHQDETHRFSKLVPDDAGKKWALQRCLDELQEFKHLPPAQRDLALQLESTVTAFGVHAAAILIAPDVSDQYPMWHSDSAEVDLLQYDMNDCEKLGLVKFDLLGLKTLSVLDNAERRTKTTPDPGRSGQQVYDLIASGNTNGVFQLETSGCQDVLRLIKVGNFNELGDILALYRPGPLAASMHEDYAKRKHKGWLPQGEIEKELASTQGLMIYQEQAMLLAQKLCGYTLADADNLRKAIGKKLPEEMAKHEQRFVEAGQAELFSTIKAFASYGFNKSHSYAYADISYQSAWYKTHHPLEFAAAYIDVNGDLSILHEMQHQVGGYSLQAIDKCAIINGKLYLPLSTLKGVGEKAVAELINISPIASVEDMLERCNKRIINKRVQEAIIKGLTSKHVAGLVLAGDPIVAKRAYYNNLGHGTTAQPGGIIPGYIINAKNFSAKKSGKSYIKFELIDEFGKIMVLADVQHSDIIKCFADTPQIVLVHGNMMQSGDCMWLNKLEV